MICRNCGKELDDGARFCPGCGTALTAENPTAPQERPVYTVYDEPKKAPKWLIPVIAVAAAAVVVLVCLLSGVFDSPAARLGKALNKSGSAFVSALKNTGLTDAAGLMAEKESSQEFSLRLEQLEGMAELEGLGIRISADVSMSDRKAALEIAPYLGAADLMKLQLKADDANVYIGSPELTEDAFFMVNTTTLGQTIEKLTGVSDLRDLNVNLFDLYAQMEQLNGFSEETRQTMLETCQAFSQAVEVSKTGTETVAVNGTDLKCDVYHVVMSQEALVNLIDGVETAYNMTDVTDAYRQMLESMGIPADAAAELAMGMGDDGMDSAAFFQELRDAAVDQGSIELDVYVSKGYAVGAVCAFSTDSTEVEIALSIGGGENYVDDISLRIREEDTELCVTSTGDHTGAGGSFTDRTEITITDSTGTETPIALELSYDPKAEADNFSCQVEADGSRISAAGQLTCSKDALYVGLDTVDLDGAAVVSIQYRLGRYEGDSIVVENTMDLGTMSEAELESALEDLSGNAQVLILGIIEQFPELMYMLY